MEAEGRGSRLVCSRLAAPSRRSVDHLGKALDRVTRTLGSGPINLLAA